MAEQNEEHCLWSQFRNERSCINYPDVVFNVFYWREERTD